MKFANSSNPNSVYKPRHFDCNVITHFLPMSPTTPQRRKQNVQPFIVIAFVHALPPKDDIHHSDGYGHTFFIIQSALGVCARNFVTCEIGFSAGGLSRIEAALFEPKKGRKRFRTELPVRMQLFLRHKRGNTTVSTTYNSFLSIRNIPPRNTHASLRSPLLGKP